MTLPPRCARSRPRRAVVLLLALAALAGSFVTGDAAPVAAAETGGARPLLVVLMNGVGKSGLGHPVSYYEQLFFGPTGTTAMPEYFSVNSRGRFTFRRAGLFQVQDRDDPALGTPSGGDDVAFLIRGLSLAGEAGFNYAPYDTNGDRVVDNTELAVVVVSNYGEAVGATRWGCQELRHRNGTRQAVSWCGWRATADHRGSFMNFAHELSHTLEPGSQDVYWDHCRSDDLTLLSCTGDEFDQRYRQVLMDPWHRINYGWIDELPHATGSWPLGTRSTMTLAPACRATRVGSIVRYETGERFIIENRRRCNGDRDVASVGIVVWYQADWAEHPDPLYSARDTNVALASLECVFSAAHARNKDHPRAVTTGRHRLWWADGTDTGADLTIGGTDLAGNTTVTITRTDRAPATSC